MVRNFDDSNGFQSYSRASLGIGMKIILDIFYPHDVEEILKLWIQSSGDGDFIAWHFEKNGFFW